jgi:hypothetical protein
MHRRTEFRGQASTALLTSLHKLLKMTLNGRPRFQRLSSELQSTKHLAPPPSTCPRCQEHTLQRARRGHTSSARSEGPLTEASQNAPRDPPQGPPLMPGAKQGRSRPRNTWEVGPTGRQAHQQPQGRHGTREARRGGSAAMGRGGESSWRGEPWRMGQND